MLCLLSIPTNVIKLKKTEKIILKLPAVVECNKFMGCVNKYDQLLSSYSIGHKSMKSWKHIFYHLLE